MDNNNKIEPVHKFCEQIFVNTSRDVFLLGFRSGGEVTAFVITPDHAKQLTRLLAAKVAEYEAAYGPLEGRLPTEPTPSPLQPKQ